MDLFCIIERILKKKQNYKKLYSQDEKNTPKIDISKNITTINNETVPSIMKEELTKTIRLKAANV